MVKEGKTTSWENTLAYANGIQDFKGHPMPKIFRGFKEIVKLPKSCTPHSYEHLAKCHQLASSSWFQNSLFINLTTLWNFEVH